jgi:hypothetical protein
MHLGLRLSAPPDFILEAQRYVWLVLGEADEPVPSLFFRA